MPSIKKFKLTFNQVPEIFSLPEGVFLSKNADSIPEEVLEQTEEQRQDVTKAIEQLDKDLDRTHYVDLEGHKASELKAYWLTRNLDETSLAKGVYPNYTQGNITGASIGEIIHTMQFAIPLSSEDTESFLQLNPRTKKICFSYRNAQGQPAGFSIVAAPNGDDEGKHKGWIISTIQNTNAKPQDRRVTVLATPNYTTSEAQSTIDTANPSILEAELKAAINNDKIFALVKGIFNQDGSINADYLADLASRTQSSINIDDRDRKMAQLDCLFDLSKRFGDINLEDQVAKVKIQITEDINFFKDGIYENHLKEVTHQLAISLKKQLIATKSVNEIETVLKNISERVAYLDKLAEESYRNIEMANTYKALAQKIQKEAATIKFDGTKHDENKIVLLSQFEVSQVQEKVKRFYATDPAVKQYFETKQQSYQKSQEDLEQLTKPSNTGFFNRNSSAIGFGLLLGLVVGIAVVLALTGVLAPLAVGLIAAASAIAVAGVAAGVDCYLTEKDHSEEVNNYNDEVANIRENNDRSLTAAEQKLQKGINLDPFLEPEKPEFLSKIKVSNSQPLTPQAVAHALWLGDKDHDATSSAKNRFSLWAAKHENLGFGIQEVESIIDQKYEMK